MVIDMSLESGIARDVILRTTNEACADDDLGLEFL